MKTLYQCEVCRRTFDTPEAARECEARVVPEPPPVGLIVTTKYLDRAGDTPFAGLFVGVEQQSRSYTPEWLWIWHRGNGAGDDTKPRSDVLQTPDNFRTGPQRTWRDWESTDVTAPAAQRAAGTARSKGLEPLVLRGGQVVPWPTEGGA